MTNRAARWTIGLAAILLAIAIAGGVWFLHGHSSTVETNSASSPATLPTSEADIAPSTPPRDPAHPTVTFDDGTVATLVGLRSFGVEPATSWGADGSAVLLPARNDPFHRSVGGFDDRHPGVEARVTFEADDLQSKSFDVRFTHHHGSATWYTGDGADRALFFGIYRLPPGLTEELEVGLASGDWQDKDTLTVADSPARAIAAEPFAVAPPRPRPIRTTQPAATKPSPAPLPTTPFRLLSITDADGRTRVTCTNNLYWPGYGEAQWRVMLRPTTGQARRYKNVDYTSDRVSFLYDLPIEKVKAAVYQERPWQWKPLGPVRLAPTSQPTTIPTTQAAGTP